MLFSNLKTWWKDVFMRDLHGGTTKALVQPQPTLRHMLGNRESQPHSMSHDGRYMLFNSTASNLVAGDRNNTQDVFVRDLQLGTTTLCAIRRPPRTGERPTAGSDEGRKTQAFTPTWAFASDARSVHSDADSFRPTASRSLAPQPPTGADPRQTLMDLLLADQSSGQYVEAWDINGDGWIVGGALCIAEDGDFLLTPMQP